ncbi:MAG: diguanylate cyclase [Thiovulaceae bacterium]|jgi:diguanylate cyclase (GGDEF)-like protein/PAS domain S-box-containing protein|nr:diguanylate cyclase [Sulfurimonadaceae bacterium]
MFENMSTKNKTLFFVSIVLFIFASLLFGFIYLEQQKKLRELEQTNLTNFRDSYSKMLKKHQEFYQNRVRANISSVGVKDALFALDRKKLYNLTQGRWNTLANENKFLKVMHFSLPSGESFLRMHDPKRFGDNAAAIRPMIAKIHEEKKPIDGFESGYFGFLYRVILPVYRNEHYIGALEFGSMPEQILEDMRYYNGLSGALFLRNNRFHTPKESVAIGEYSLIFDNFEDDALLKTILQEYDFYSQEHKEVDGRIYVLYAFDLHDFEGTTTAKVVFFNDITESIGEYKAMMWKIFVFLVSLLVVLLVVINIGFKKFITILDKTNDELHANQKFLQSILDYSAHAIIATDTEGTITMFNKQAQKFLGYSAEEVVGVRNITLFYHREDLARRAEEFFKLFKKHLNPDFNVCVEKTRQHLENSDEWRFFDKNNQEYYVRINVTALSYDDKNIDGYNFIIEDITASKKASKKIKDYIHLIDQNIITSTTDLNGKITHISHAFCKISGYEKSELLGHTHDMMKHPDLDKNFYKNMWNELLNDRVWRGEIKNLKKEGGYYWIDTTIYPIFDEAKNKIGYTSIGRDITEKKMLEELSITDGLTEIYNRRHFNDIFAQMIALSKRKNELLSFLIIDVDYFKQYNDTYGHQKGDNALKEVAKAIKTSLRRADDYCFRLGGEEFGVVFKPKDKQEAIEFAYAIKNKIEDLKITHDTSEAGRYLSVSIGLVSHYAKEIKDDDTIYKEADELLYEAKARGRNRLVSN